MDDLHSKIDEWHNLPHGSPGSDISLHEYLGLTWEEYKHLINQDVIQLDESRRLL